MSNKLTKVKHPADRIFVGLWIFGQISCYILFSILVWLLFSKPSGSIVDPTTYSLKNVYPKRFGFYDVYVSYGWKPDSKPEGTIEYNRVALLALLLFIFMILYISFLLIFVRPYTKSWFKSASYSRTMIIILAGVLILLIAGLTVGKPASQEIKDVDYDLAWSSWMFNHADGSNIDSAIKMFSWSKTSIVIFSSEMVILFYTLVDGVTGIIASVQRHKSQRSYQKLLIDTD